MTLPDYQSVTLPLLKLTASSAQVRLSDAFGIMAKHFQLNDADLAEKTASGKTKSASRRRGAREEPREAQGSLNILRQPGYAGGFRSEARRTPPQGHSAPCLATEGTEWSAGVSDGRVQPCVGP